MESHVSNAGDSAETVRPPPARRIRAGSPAKRPRYIYFYEVLDGPFEREWTTLYRARDTRTDSEVALRVIKHTPEKNEHWLFRLRYKFMLAACVNHMNLASYFECHEWKQLILARKWVDGISLREYLRKVDPGLAGSEEALRNCLYIFSQLVCAVEYMYKRRLPNLRLHPDNIILSENFDVKITDYAIQVEPYEGAIPIISKQLAPYTAPEVFDGSNDSQLKADIYTLGAILYEMMGGSPPFHGLTPEEIREKHREGCAPEPNLNPRRTQAAQLFEKYGIYLMEKDPNGRTESAEKVSEVFLRLLQRTGEFRKIAAGLKLKDRTIPGGVGKSPELWARQLVERDQEWALMNERLRQVSEGKGDLVMLAGEPGIGKTRLLEEIRQSWLWRYRRCYSAACPVSDSMPYGVFKQLFNEVCSELEGREWGDLRPLVKAVKKHAASLRPLIKMSERGFAHEIRWIFEQANPYNQFEIFAVVAEVIKFLARESAVVLFIDDLQWVDEVSLKLLDYLVRNVIHGEEDKKISDPDEDEEEGEESLDDEEEALPPAVKEAIESVRDGGGKAEEAGKDAKAAEAGEKEKKGVRQGPTNRSVLIFAAYRNDKLEQESVGFRQLLSDLARDNFFTELKLKRLTVNGTERMIYSMVGKLGKVDHLVKPVWESSHGNPYLVEDTVRTLIETGAIEAKDLLWVLHRDKFKTLLQERKLGPGVDIADAIGRLVNSRMDFLENKYKPILEKHGLMFRQILRPASLMGSVFHFEVIRELLETTEDDLIDVIELLMRQRVVAEAGDKQGDYFFFRQNRTSEVFERSYTEEEKVELHKKLGYCWERVFAKKDSYYLNVIDRLENHYLEVARHFAKGRDVGKALQYLPHAGLRYKLSWSIAEAIDKYEQFLAFLKEHREAGGQGFEDEKADVLKNLAEVYLNAAKYEKALHCYEEMLRDAETALDSPPPTSPAPSAQDPVSSTVCQSDSAIGVAPVSSPQAPDGPASSSVYRSDSAIGDDFFDVDYPEVREGKKGIWNFGELKVFSIGDVLKKAEKDKVSPEEFRRRVREALTGDKYPWLDVLLAKVPTVEQLKAMKQNPQPEGAEKPPPVLSGAPRPHARHQYRRILALNGMGESLWRLARYKDAIDSCRRARALAASLGDPHQTARSFMLEGGALRALGEYDHAIDSYLRALNLFINLRHRRDAAEVLNRLGNACYYKGDDDESVSYYERARRFYRRWSMLDRLSMVEMNIGALFARKGDHLKAIDYYKRALGNYWRISRKRSEISCLNAIAQSYLSIGDYDDAAIYLDSARELAEKLDDDGMKTETLFYMGYCYCEKKDFGNALKLYSKVEEKAETLNRKDLLVQVYCEKAWVFCEQNDVENAERYASKVLGMSAGTSRYFHARSLLLLSKIQTSAQAFKSAEDALGIAQALHERFLKILCLNELALINHELRNLENARKCFDEAIRMAASIAENLGELKNKYYQKAEIRNLLDGYVNFMMETEGKPLEKVAEENKLVKEVLFDGFC